MRYGSLAVIALFILACRNESERPRDTIKITMTPVTGATVSDSAPSSKPVTPGCEHTGQWAECSLERRLKQQGFVVKRTDESVTRAGFTPKPVIYMLGTSRLEAFFYRSEGALSKDMQSIDTVTAAPKGAAAPWPSTPVLIRSANLAAVFLGQSPRQIERLTLAITAGPPQPGSPR